MTVLAETQSFIADSTLVFPESKRKGAIRDAVIVNLLKTGGLNETQLMLETLCDYKYLGPVIETVAFTDKRTRKYSLKTYSGELDETVQATITEAESH